MKKTIALLFLIYVLLMFSGCEKVPPVPMGYFFLEACPGCESYQKAEELGGLVIVMNASGQYEGRGWNMAYGDPDANDTLLRMIEERNLPDLTYVLPLLIIGDEYFAGYEDIETELRSRVKEIRGE